MVSVVAAFAVGVGSAAEGGLGCEGMNGGGSVLCCVNLARSDFVDLGCVWLHQGALSVGGSIKIGLPGRPLNHPSLPLNRSFWKDDSLINKPFWKADLRELSFPQIFDRTILPEDRFL